MLEAVSRSLSPGFTLDALNKRKQILNARPVMIQKQLQPSPTTTSPKKRGKK
jgi:hypothetical protein